MKKVQQETKTEPPQISPLANLHELLQKITDDFQQFYPLQTFSQIIKIPAGNLLLGSFLTMLFLILLGIFPRFLSSVIGMVYPSYMTMKIIRIEQKELRFEEKLQWISYWMVFSFLDVFDNIIHLLLFFIPFYYPIRACFFVWMFYPRSQTNPPGAALLYDAFINMFIKRFEKLLETLKKKKN